MTTVYHLYHFHIAKDEEDLDHLGEPDEKHIGVFSTEKKAGEAADFLRGQLGFRRWPDGFRIYEAEVDDYGWKDGFMSIDEDEPEEGGSVVRP